MVLFICIHHYYYFFFCYNYSQTERDVFQFIDKELEVGKEGLTIMTDFEPIVISTMTKFSSRQQVSNYSIAYNRI